MSGAACDMLESWLDAKPDRSVVRIARIGGSYRVTLSGWERYESTTQQTLDSAIRTCLMIAWQAGDR